MQNAIRGAFLVLLMLSLACSVTIGEVYAEDPLGNSTPEVSRILGLVSAVISTFEMLLYGAFCYTIDKVKKNEAFTPEQFAKTLLIGFVIGATGYFIGIPATDLEGMSFAAVLSIIIDKIVGLLLHRKAPS